MHVAAGMHRRFRLSAYCVWRVDSDIVIRSHPYNFADSLLTVQSVVAIACYYQIATWQI